MVQITQQLIADKVKPKYIISGTEYIFSMDPEYITVHETANVNVGAGAKAHARLQEMGNQRSASWHIQVDDKYAIQSLPYTEAGMAAGDGRNGTGNRKSIHVEMCVNSNSNFKNAVDNTADVVKQLMEMFNIPASKVVQHNKWSGKNCPTFLRNGSKGINWTQFKAKLTGVTVAPTKPSKPVRPAPTTKPTGNLGLVDWMYAKGMNASYSNRAIFAKKYKINGYKGTASQNIELLAKLKKGYAPKASKSTSKPTGNSRIKKVQSTLNSWYNAGLRVDGVNGPKTKTALIRAYQTELNKQFNAGLVVDGKWGPKSKKASITVRKGATGNITWVIQAMLYCLGYDPKGLDGIFGGGTEEAVKKFQKSKKLTQDGEPGKVTLSKMFG